MTGLIELGIVAGVGAVAYGAHKTGALRKIYTGILGKVDSIAEKVKDPIVEMQLKQARLVEHSGKLAEIAKEANGKKHQIEESKKDIEAELAKLVPEYEAKLVELKEKGSDIGQLPHPNLLASAMDGACRIQTL